MKNRLTAITWSMWVIIKHRNNQQNNEHELLVMVLEIGDNFFGKAKVVCKNGSTTFWI